VSLVAGIGHAAVFGFVTFRRPCQRLAPVNLPQLSAFAVLCPLGIPQSLDYKRNYLGLFAGRPRLASTAPGFARWVSPTTPILSLF
jgi:hypothetical protein